MNGGANISVFGTVGKDAETRLVKTDTNVASFTVVVNRVFKKNGEQQKEADWYNVEVWGEKAKFAGSYVKKGSVVFVSGTPKIEKYKNKEGVEVATIKINCTDIQLAPDGKHNAGTNGKAEAATSQATEYVGSQKPAVTGTNESFVPVEEEDDLPF